MTPLHTKVAVQRAQSLLKRHLPELGNVVSATEWQYDEKLGVQVAAGTDGESVLIGPRFHELDAGEAAWIYLHQLIHIVWGHWPRPHERDECAWNVTIDLVTAHMARAFTAHCAEFVKDPTRGAWLRSIPQGVEVSTDSIYDLIKSKPGNFTSRSIDRVQSPLPLGRGHRPWRFVDRINTERGESATECDRKGGVDRERDDQNRNAGQQATDPLQADLREGEALSENHTFAREGNEHCNDACDNDSCDNDSCDNDSCDNDACNGDIDDDGDDRERARENCCENCERDSCNNEHSCPCGKPSDCGCERCQSEGRRGGGQSRKSRRSKKKTPSNRSKEIFARRNNLSRLYRAARRNLRAALRKHGLGSSRDCGSELVQPVDAQDIAINEIQQRLEASAYEGDGELRFNRRLMHQDLYIPKDVQQRLGPILIAIDTSGSMSKLQLGCIQSFLERLLQLGVYGTTLDFDTDVQKVRCMDSLEAPTPAGLNNSLNRLGRGGTDLRAPFRWLETSQECFRLIVIFTDGDGVMPESAPDLPVVWIDVLTRPRDSTNVQLTPRYQPPFGSIYAFGPQESANKERYS
jgi:hypothetical protein